LIDKNKLTEKNFVDIVIVAAIGKYKGNKNKTIKELDDLHQRMNAKFEKIFEEYPNDNQKEKLKSFITEIHIKINEEIKKIKIKLEKNSNKAYSRKR
jgi:hypothetical protein